MKIRTALVQAFLPWLWLTQVLVGCHSEPAPAPATSPPTISATPPPMQSSAPASMSDRWYGHVGGTVFGVGMTAAQDSSVDGVVTSDGQIRLDMSPYDQPYEESVQFVGRIDFDGERAFGNGVVIGQACAAEARHRFCGHDAFAEITLTASSSGSNGTIEVVGPNGPETWLLSLQLWGYDAPAELEYFDGTYELRSEFTSDGATLVSVDRAGRLFFQSPSSECVGNGALTPRPESRFDVFDVTLRLENCRAEHGFLNGVFEGLATEDPSGPWDYDSVLYVWISTPPGAPVPAALTMTASLF